MEDAKENVGGLEVSGSISSSVASEKLSTLTPNSNESASTTKSCINSPTSNVVINNEDEYSSRNIAVNTKDNSSSNRNTTVKTSDVECNNNDASSTGPLETFLRSESDELEELTFSSFKSRVVYKDISGNDDLEAASNESLDDDNDEENSAASSEDGSSGFHSGGTGMGSIAFESYLGTMDMNSLMMDQNHQLMFDDEDYDDNDESDAFLSPVDRLRRQAASLTVATRENVCPAVASTLQQVEGSPLEVEALMEMVQRLADDPAVVVRSRMLAAVPRLMAVCDNLQSLRPLFSSHLMPLLLRHTTHAANQNAIMDVLERNLLTDDEVEQLCCQVASITEVPGHEPVHRPMLVTLIARLAPVVGLSSLTNHLLPRLRTLCADHYWQVRKACAQQFGRFAGVVGLQVMEDVLVPLFVSLVNDQVWDVRKACCEAFTEVSVECLPATRHTSLGCLYLQLLADKSGWVRACAYENLGMFISSYAVADEDIATNLENDSLISSQSDQYSTFNYWKLPLPVVTLPSIPVSSSVTALTNGLAAISMSQACEQKTTVVCETVGPAVQFSEILAEERRGEGVDLNLSSDSTDSEDTVIDLLSMHDGLIAVEEFKRGATIPNLGLSQPGDDDYAPPLMRLFKKISTSGDLDPVLSAEINAVVSTQSVVPKELLRQFLLMVDPQKAAHGVNDIAFNCAYAMPAVALTVGKDNWHVLSATYAHLAKNYQWRVRRTLAHSIAIIADIIGPQNAARDLLPVYGKLLTTDSEFVKLGLLDNMAGLVRALPAYCRAEVLGLQQHFSLKEWKTRELIAAQLQDMIQYYTVHEVEQYLMNYCTELLSDTVVHNRTKTLRLMSLVIQRLLDDGTSDVVEELSHRLCERFALSSSWTQRQTFVLFCERLWNDAVLLPELFCTLFLSALLKLAYDCVPNVRLALAEVLSRSFVRHTLFADEACDVRSTYCQLQVDTDRDVRTLACSLVPEDSICMPSIPQEKTAFCRDVQTPSRGEEVYYRLEDGNLVRADYADEGVGACEEVVVNDSSELDSDTTDAPSQSGVVEDAEACPDWW